MNGFSIGTEPLASSEIPKAGKPLKTLFLNPPSFEKFDGGASSRWPATREIESYWYPVWLTYPAGMLEGSRLVDAPPHHISWREVIALLKDYKFLVLFTSTVGWDGDQGMSELIKETYPAIKIAFSVAGSSISPSSSLPTVNPSTRFWVSATKTQTALSTTIPTVPNFPPSNSMTCLGPLRSTTAT
jgi:hypothetical protein